MAALESSWIVDLDWSAKAFQNLVWPILVKEIGGRLIHVEAITRNDFAKDLDRQSGIDAWHIVDNAGIRGIASRVQVCPPIYPPYNTFTVRKSRNSGAKTEYQKRVEAIQSGDGWLYPILTVQAYVTQEQGGQLRSFAMARTVDIIKFIQSGLARTKPTSNAEFYIVPFADVAQFRYESPLIITSVV